MKTSKLLLLSGIFVSLGMLASCADDDLANGGGKNAGDKGTAVTFNVSYAQDDAQNAMVAPAAGNTRASAGTVTRASFANGLAMLGLTPEDLTSQKLPVSGADNACLIETTTAGVNPPPVQVAGAPQTRAQITTIDKFPHFYTTGFCTESSGEPCSKAWFENEDTNPSGTLVRPIYWSKDKPYGKFFAVALAQTDKSNIKSTLVGNPVGLWVDFEVDPNVRNQQDLMTASSKEVCYDTPGKAPSIPLQFRHALTAVRFKVGQNLSYDKTITKVEIIGAASKGHYRLPINDNGHGGLWMVEPNSKKTFTLDNVQVKTSEYVNSIIVGKSANKQTHESADNYIFYMIPQKLTGKDKDVQVQFTFSDGSKIISTLKGEWKAGTTKTYALSEYNSTWNYQITVLPYTSEVASTGGTASCTIESFRKYDGAYVNYPVPLKVVGYEESIDGQTVSHQKPDWLTSLTIEKDKHDNHIITATLKPTTIVDKLAEYNKVLKEAKTRGTQNDPYDLSMYEIDGTPRKNMTTANCYLISAPGWYKIPLVYGNGIVGGALNEKAFLTNNSGDFILTRFTDHDGDGIMTPYINCQSWGNFATHASIVWTDQPGIVEKPSVKLVEDNSVERRFKYRDSYLMFHVPADKIKNGNAVICVKNKQNRKGEKNVTMWSWHLWFAQKDALSIVGCNDKENNYYKFAKQPLGFAYRKWEEPAFNKQRKVSITFEQAYSQGGDKKYVIIEFTQKPSQSVKEFSSTLYQFGNKNAYPSISFYKSAQGEHIADGELKIIISDEMSVENSIMYPELFYTGGSGWFKKYNYYNLWSMDNTNPMPDNSNGIKTIFDPCPVGFHVPPAKAFKCFTIDGTSLRLMKKEGDWDQGFHFRRKLSFLGYDITLYIPYVSCRNIYNNLDSKNNRVSYWTSNMYENNAGGIFIDNTKVGNAFFARAWALPVLPVSE